MCFNCLLCLVCILDIFIFNINIYIYISLYIPLRWYQLCIFCNVILENINEKQFVLERKKGVSAIKTTDLYNGRAWAVKLACLNSPSSCIFSYIFNYCMYINYHQLKLLIIFTHLLFIPLTVTFLFVCSVRFIFPRLRTSHLTLNSYNLAKTAIVQEHHTWPHTIEIHFYRISGRTPHIQPKVDQAVIEIRKYGLLRNWKLLLQVVQYLCNNRKTCI